MSSLVQSRRIVKILKYNQSTGLVRSEKVDREFKFLVEAAISEAKASPAKLTPISGGDKMDVVEEKQDKAESAAPVSAPPV